MKDHFQLEHQDTISRESVAIRPGGIMVTMRDVANPVALKWILARTKTEDRDVVVMSVRMMGVGGPEYLSAEQQSFSEHEQMLFTKAVSVAESFGKKVSLLVVPAGDVFAALAQGANSLEVDSVVSGHSTSMTAEDQAFHMGQAWEALAGTETPIQFLRGRADGETKVFYIGPHAPTLEPGRCATCAPAVAEYAPRSIGAGPASQRHHHLCADAASRPVCAREGRDPARSAELSRFGVSHTSNRWAGSDWSCFAIWRSRPGAAAKQTSPRGLIPIALSPASITFSPASIERPSNQE